MTKLSDKEQAWGLVYTLFSLFMLPALLQQLLRLSAVWLNIVYYVLNFSILLFLLRRFLKKSIAYAGKHPLTMVLFPMAGFVVYYLCNFAVSTAISWIFPNFTNYNDGQLSAMFSESFVLMALGTVILVPVAEELMHRALIFGSLYKASPLAAYLVSTLFFAAVHVLGYVGSVPNLTLALSFLQYIPAGLILAFCYKKSGCIFVSIFLHAAINAVGVFALR